MIPGIKKKRARKLWGLTTAVGKFEHGRHISKGKKEIAPCYAGGEQNKVEAVCS